MANMNDERLEFLGDRVLALVMTEWLFELFPNEDEGGLGKRLSHLVSRTVLAQVARAEGRRGDSDRLLANAVETEIAKAYRMGRLSSARTLIRDLWRDQMTAQQSSGPVIDAKTRLQDFVQKRGLKTVWDLVRKEGPPHAPTFYVIADIYKGSKHVTSGHGAGGTMRAAQQDAAERMLTRNCMNPKAREAGWGVAMCSCLACVGLRSA